MGLLVVKELTVAKYRNVSGQTLDIPAVGRAVEDDGVFEVPTAHAPGFDCQPTNYKRLDEASKKESK